MNRQRGGFIERHYRPAEAAQLTGLALATIRKLVAQRKIAYRKPARAILIPESEVRRIMGELRPAIQA
jgi:excisionase family DNA binding protein